jgi:hypothetical protein
MPEQVNNIQMKSTSTGDQEEEASLPAIALFHVPTVVQGKQHPGQRLWFGTTPIRIEQTPTTKGAMKAYRLLEQFQTQHLLAPDVQLHERHLLHTTNGRAFYEIATPGGETWYVHPSTKVIGQGWNRAGEQQTRIQEPLTIISDHFAT